LFLDLSETEALLLDMHLGGLGDDRVRMSMTHLSVSVEARGARVVTCVILGQEHMMRFFLTLMLLHDNRELLCSDTLFCYCLIIFPEIFCD
jgi:hypothetical protein